MSGKNAYINFVLQEKEKLLKSGQPIPKNLNQELQQRWKQLDSSEKNKLLEQQQKFKQEQARKNLQMDNNDSDDEEINMASKRNIRPWQDSKKQKSQPTQKNSRKTNQKSQVIDIKSENTQKKVQNQKLLPFERVLQERDQENKSVCSDDPDSFSNYLEQLQDELAKKQDISMPKLPCNPYLRYHTEQINRIKKNQPSITQKMIGKQTKEEWADLSKLMKDKYIESYNEDIKQYNILKKEFQLLTYGPKKPATPYFSYFAKQLPQYKTKFPRKTQLEITQEIATAWNKMGKDEKEMYQLEYMEEKVKYSQQQDWYQQNKDNWMYYQDYLNKKNSYEDNLKFKVETYKNKYPKPQPQPKLPKEQKKKVEKQKNNKNQQEECSNQDQQEETQNKKKSGKKNDAIIVKEEHQTPKKNQIQLQEANDELQSQNGKSSKNLNTSQFTVKSEYISNKTNNKIKKITAAPDQIVQMCENQETGKTEYCIQWRSSQKENEWVSEDYFQKNNLMDWFNQKKKLFQDSHRIENQNAPRQTRFSNSFGKIQNENKKKSTQVKSKNNAEKKDQQKKNEKQTSQNKKPAPKKKAPAKKAAAKTVKKPVKKTVEKKETQKKPAVKNSKQSQSRKNSQDSTNSQNKKGLAQSSKKIKKPTNSNKKSNKK